MPAAYDLNRSNYTIQNITNKWKSRITILNLERCKTKKNRHHKTGRYETQK